MEDCNAIELLIAPNCSYLLHHFFHGEFFLEAGNQDLEPFGWDSAHSVVGDMCSRHRNPAGIALDLLLLGVNNTGQDIRP